MSSQRAIAKKEKKKNYTRTANVSWIEMFLWYEAKKRMGSEEN